MTDPRATRLGLARLYPRAFRDYWGEEFTGAIHGWRDAPDLVREAARQWAHPALWPAAGPAERRNRARTTGLAIAVVAGWITALLAEFGGDRSRPALVVLTAGTALLTPWTALLKPWTTLARIARPLALPTLAGAAIVAVANASALDRHDQPAAVLVLTAWWATLLWAAVTAVRALTPTSPAPPISPAPPTPARLTGGLAAVAAGGAVLAAGALAHHRGPAGLATAAAFAALAAIALTTLTDIRLLPAR